MFTTASGVNGPTVATAGTYLIDVTVASENLTLSAVQFSCFVAVPSNLPGLPATAAFGQTYELPEGSSSRFTLSGMTTLQAGTTPTVGCFSDAGEAPTVEGANWYVAPVQTAG